MRLRLQVLGLVPSQAVGALRHETAAVAASDDLVARVGARLLVEVDAGRHASVGRAFVVQHEQVVVLAALPLHQAQIGLAPPHAVVRLGVQQRGTACSLA